MPSSPKDPTCNEKRKYIGNDYVSIVYNDSGADFNIHTIKVNTNLVSNSNAATNIRHPSVRTLGGLIFGSVVNQTLG